MFWKKFGFHASGVDALLDREDVDLESILDEDDLLNECKSQNTRLIDYFQRVDVLRRLLGYASGQIEREGIGRFKYPHVATEVLCSEIWSIVETCVRESDQLLLPFWDNMLDMRAEELSTRVMVVSNFTKINGVFMIKKPEEMFAFIRAQPNVIDRLLHHIETPAFVELIFRIIQLEDHPGGAGVIDWMTSQHFIKRLVSLLSPANPPDIHVVVADLIKGIINLCAPSPGNSNDHGSGLITNRFSRELVSEENVHTMVGYMLDSPSSPSGSVDTLDAKIHLDDSDILHSRMSEDARSSSPTSSSASSSSSHPDYESAPSSISERSTSSLLHIASIIIELMRKNNSDFFEPYLFHTVRHRLIQIQQQYLPHVDRTGHDPAKRVEEDRETLEAVMADMVDQMGIVHFGGLLNVLSARLGDFQALLQKPRSFSGPIMTTTGEIMPLTLERFRICELYAELLHCSSLSLLNRPVGYGPTYDSEGRLTGGLAALEELARVISNGPNDAPGTPPAPNPRSLDTESPINSREFPVSMASTDGSFISESSESDGESFHAGDYEESGDGSDEGDETDSDDMEEIDMHNGTREPLPPLVVPSQGPPLYDGPPLVVPSSAVAPPPPPPPLVPLGLGPAPDYHDDPFTDPNSIPPSPPSDPTLSVSVSSISNSRILLPPSNVLASTDQSPTGYPAGLAGNHLKRRFLDLNVISTILDLFFDFPWNNFLHNVVYDILHQFLAGRVERGLNRELTITLFREGRLLHRIVEAQARNDVECSNPKGVRLGFMGHLTLISEDVTSAFANYPADLLHVLSQYAPQPAWDEYLSGRFREAKERDASQLGGGKPVVVPGQNPKSEAGAGRGGVFGRVDEADKIPVVVGGGGRGAGPVINNDETNGQGKGPTPQPTGPTPRPQNVVFASTNEGEGEVESDKFARYLMQTMNTSSNGHFESSSSETSDDDDDDDDDDVGWLGDTHFSSAGDFDIAAAGNGVGSFGDEFGFSSRQNQNQSGFARDTTGVGEQRSFDDDPFNPDSRSDDASFGPFADPEAAQAAHTNFTADLSGDFSFPSSSTPMSNGNTNIDFDINSFGDSATTVPSNFSFGTGGFDDDDDDDAFGDFQGGVGLEVVMSTNPDGISEEIDIPSHHINKMRFESWEDEDEDIGSEGEKTPTASKLWFDDHPPGDSLNGDIDPDPFGVRTGGRPIAAYPSSASSRSRSNSGSDVGVENKIDEITLDEPEPSPPFQDGFSMPGRSDGHFTLH